MSYELNDNLKYAYDLCRSEKNYRCSDFSIIYPFATENISQYIDLFDLKGKSLLTVGSSGDQAINAILNGAKNVTQLDINDFSKYNYFLKMASILCLSIDEVINFFSYNEKLGSNLCDISTTFSKDTFDKIGPTLKTLDSESFEFWSNLFENYPSIDIRSHLFHRDNRSYVIKKCNKYLQSTELFEETRKKIKKTIPEFIKGNVCDIEIKMEYDNVWLSNIAAYLNNSDSNKLLEKMLKCLTPNGKLLMEYIYIYRSYLSHKYRHINNYESQVVTFDGCEGISPSVSNVSDAVLIYRKTKK